MRTLTLMNFVTCCGGWVLLKESVAATTFSAMMEFKREFINIQPRGRTAKTYQVVQVRGIILKYRLGDESNE